MRKNYIIAEPSHILLEFTDIPQYCQSWKGINEGQCNAFVILAMMRIALTSQISCNQIIIINIY